MKNIILLTLIITTFSINTSKTYFKVDQDEKHKLDDSKNNKEIVLTFDLNKFNESESVIIENQYGQQTIFSIEKKFNNEENQLKSLKNDTYIISYKTLTEKISYKINVSEGRITSAHSGSYSVFGYTVDSSKLRKISNKEASYILNCSILYRSWTSKLKSKITSSNELVISFKKS